MNATDEGLARIILSNRLATQRDIDEVHAWGARLHPEKDLAEHLFMRGVIDRGQVSLVRRIAKMSRHSGRKSRPSKARKGPAGPKNGGEPAASEDALQGDEPTGVLGRTAREEAETGELPADGGEAAEVVAPAPRRRRASGATRDPERVGRYEIVERVAQGGMGVVYKAHHPDLDRLFALKVLTARVTASDEALTRFQREAKIAAKLDHPNIVRVYDAGTDDGAPYLVMDFVDGPNLDALVREEGIGARKAARIARSLALALHYAHEQGFVHRDIKPENVLIDRRTDEPKITDFGIVKELAQDTQPDEARLTQTGFTLGSPCYMSPEQAAGRHEQVGAASDVYSLAATLYEMLTGGPPFEGASIHEIMVRVIRDEVVPLRRKNPAIPPDLEVVCLKALEKEPARRYATAQELAADLGRFLDGEPVLAKPAGLPTKVWRVVRRHRAVAALVVVLSLALAAGGAYLGYQERQRRLEAAARLRMVVDDARERVAAAAEAEDPSLTRRSYYQALLRLETVLHEEPEHEEALALKREVIMTLGDHLIESGEASFAEFVFSLGGGMIDQALIASRVAAARLGHWEEAAREQEQAGDLEEALRLYRTAAQELERAGYSALRLVVKAEQLAETLDRRSQRQRVSDFLSLAQEAFGRGDPAVAYATARQAQALAPDDPDVQAKVGLYHREVTGEVLRRVTAVRNARAQVLTALSDDGATHDALQALLTRADRLLDEAEAARHREEFGAALANLEQAVGGYRSAYAMARAIHARSQAEEAETKAEEGHAPRFAPQEMGRARDFKARGQAAFERGDHEEAVAEFERASSEFRKARARGSGKEVVAEARIEARRVRAEAFQALNPEHRLPAFRQAEEEYQQAEAHYSREEYERARELFERTHREFGRILEQVPMIREAFGVQARVRNLEAEARRNMAETFAPDELAEGLALAETADQTLLRGDAEAAAEVYRRAAYKLSQANKTAQPQAEGQRSCDALRARAEELRARIVEAGLEWKPTFQKGLEDLKLADEYRDERQWRLAERRYGRAIRHFEQLF